MEQELSVEERLAQAMIDLRKGHNGPETNNMVTFSRKEDLILTIQNIRKKIDFLSKENELLKDLRKKTESLKNQINPIREVDAHFLPVICGRFHGTRDISIQTELVSTEFSNIPHKAEKFKLINNLTNRGQMLKQQLRDTQVENNHRGDNYLLLKISEYNDLVSQVREIENGLIVPPTNINPIYSTGPTSTTTTDSLKIGITTNSSSSNNNGVVRVHEESDDEGVQLLLSMKRNAFNCKCGEYLSSITDWSEHQKICSKSTQKTIGEQCQLCKKTFLSCVALNIHSTKKHNKKKIRTDSVMHCPCGQSFTAKWRQNCVHKLNSHGRHCQAFKARETQCSICKKGFIDRKSLEYHGLKAHKLAVPVNS